ncbi:hypothetical protein Y032_0319g2367 [Ancylostoma ceylanicum]|uniref:Uncharacterized protein n=1 Tax=Ancylostoma ceylanicum TaxID=53326 RepID=A0A016S229_9BILA|nr:hypothetical protein Y032_0319g2367 [Ancylostoma ceylanicum]
MVGLFRQSALCIYVYKSMAEDTGAIITMIPLFGLLLLIAHILPTTASETRSSLENVFHGCHSMDKGHRAYLYWLIMKEAGLLRDPLPYQCGRENYSNTLIDGGDTQSRYQLKFGFTGKKERRYTDDYDFLLDAGKELGLKIKLYAALTEISIFETSLNFEAIRNDGLIGGEQRETRRKTGNEVTVFHASKARTSFPLRICALNATISCGMVCISYTTLHLRP